MIWDSIALMTLIDVVIVGLVVATFAFVASHRLAARGSRATALLVAGLGVLGSFYLLDLLVMHIVPLVWDRALSMRLMELLHLEVNWIMTPVAIGLIFAGFFALHRAQQQLEREVIDAGERRQLAIARDLHDGLGQTLTAISLGCSALTHKLKDDAACHADAARELAKSAQEAIAQTKRLSQALAPAMEKSLDKTLSNLARQTSLLYDIECRAQVSDCDIELDDRIAMHIYRIAQESVTNAVKHASATEIELSLSIEPAAIRLEIRDNGCGLDPEALRKPGLGLSNMAYRAGVLGGRLEIQPLSPAGTIVSCRIPHGDKWWAAAKHAPRPPAAT